MTQRPELSAKRRFDIFKRDGFTCLYCGATPPGVLLHIDHIVAVANGGTSDDENLATACQRCNLGKGAHPLTATPQSLAEKAEETAEREAQLRGWADIMRQKRERLDAEAWQVAEILYPGCESVLKSELASIRRFLERLGLPLVQDAAEVASATSIYSDKRRFRYFCGVCWNRVRELEAGGQPE